MNTRELARCLQAEFVIQHRAGMTDCTDDFLVQFLERELLRGRTTTGMRQPNFMWAYYINGHLHLRHHKALSDQVADGFTWTNPRVRKVAIIYPESISPSRGQGVG